MNVRSTAAPLHTHTPLEFYAMQAAAEKQGRALQEIDRLQAQLMEREQVCERG